MKAGDLTVQLTWSGLGAPFCFALPPDKSATGKHSMPSLFVPLPGRDASRSTARRCRASPCRARWPGHTLTTAMLAFSETWIRA